MRPIKGVMSLYDITGYLSDVLSYSRILALGLAGGIIANVFNLLGTIARLQHHRRDCLRADFSSLVTSSTWQSAVWVRMYIPPVCSTSNSLANSMKPADALQSIQSQHKIHSHF